MEYALEDVPKNNLRCNMECNLEYTLKFNLDYNLKYNLGLIIDVINGCFDLELYSGVVN